MPGQAFSERVGRILAESGENTDKWKYRLLHARGAKVTIMVDCIQGLELVIGKQPPVKKPPPKRSLKPFYHNFLNFIQSRVERLPAAMPGCRNDGLYINTHEHEPELMKV